VVDCWSVTAFSGPSRRARGAAGPDVLRRYENERRKQPHILVLLEYRRKWIARCACDLRPLAKQKDKDKAILLAQAHHAGFASKPILVVEQCRNSRWEDSTWRPTCSCHWRAARPDHDRDSATDSALAHWWGRHVAGQDRGLPPPNLPSEPEIATSEDASRSRQSLSSQRGHQEARPAGELRSTGPPTALKRRRAICNICNLEFVGDVFPRQPPICGECARRPQ
jgi:hypothetical protein